jgi:hypothetical protein
MESRRYSDGTKLLIKKVSEPSNRSIARGWCLFWEMGGASHMHLRKLHSGAHASYSIADRATPTLPRGRVVASFAVGAAMITSQRAQGRADGRREPS